VSKLYLTIDDGPSPRFRDLIDFLHERKIPAVLFNRGDHMQARPDDVIYGIKRGYLMANHGYAHQRASTLSFEEVCADIIKADEILGELYKAAGVARPGKYFRFPYMDRGMGPALAEAALPEYERAVSHLITEGLGHAPRKPTAAEIQKKHALQDFLKTQGFEILPTPGVTLDWYTNTELSQAIDSLCTFSTSDWVLNARHKGRFGFETVADLKRKIDDDTDLKNEASAHIILAHDGPEIYDATTALIQHFLDTGFEFLDFHTE
jgi:peptidoglycan/xylan/chitin deacetylase (PgdA/CDA1 family)